MNAQINGAGATFPSKIYDRWAQSFAKEAGQQVIYKGTGSGDGIKQITERAVDFGGTDSPLPSEELAKRRLVQMPMMIGGIVPPVLNVPGIGSKKMLLFAECWPTSWQGASRSGTTHGSPASIRVCRCQLARLCAS